MQKSKSGLDESPNKDLKKGTNATGCFPLDRNQVPFFQSVQSHQAADQYPEIRIVKGNDDFEENIRATEHIEHGF